MKIFKRIVILFICFMLVALSILSAARIISADNIPESTTSFVNDYADVLSDDTETYIADKAATLDEGAEILVVTTDYIVGNDLEEFCYNLFNQWAIGSSTYNNGVLITLVTQEEKYWVTVGTGLESELSASILSDILNDKMEADFDKKDYDAAVTNTFDAIFEIVADKYGTVEEETSSTPVATTNTTTQYSSKKGGLSLLYLPFVFVALIFIIVITLIRSVFRARRPRGYNRPVGGGYRDDFRDYRMPRGTERPRSSGFSRGSSGGHSSPGRSSGGFRSSSSSRSSFSSHSSSSSRSSRSSGGGSSRGGGAGRH